MEYSIKYIVFRRIKQNGYNIAISFFRYFKSVRRKRFIVPITNIRTIVLKNNGYAVRKCL